MVRARRTDSPTEDEPTIEERVAAALEYSIASDWKHAAEENQAILDAEPGNTEAANRLGKAYTELGKPRKAEEAYQQTLEHDPNNAIARKNLERLAAGRKKSAPKKAKKQSPKSRAKSRSATSAEPSEAISPTAMIEASSTAREFELERPIIDELAKLDVGDGARLEPTERGVAVWALTGELLGQIEPRAGLRLRRLMEGGNRYAVIIRAVTGDGATVYVKETRRDPSQLGQASFLPPPAAKRKKSPRAYTRRSAVVDDSRADDPDNEEPDEWKPRAESSDEFEGTGFSEANEDDEEPADDAEDAEDDEIAGEDDEPPEDDLEK
jgi:hypothetical protein